MTSTDRRRARLATSLAATVAATGATLVVGWALLDRYAPTDTARGFLIGGGIAAALVVLAILRAHLRPSAAASPDRVLAHLGDERDALIAREALAAVGLAALLLSGLATGLVAAGVDALGVTTAETYLLLALLVIAWRRASARH
jgi:tetrahydromethanopterin S-methyltransferase subunit F